MLGERRQVDDRVQRILAALLDPRQQRLRQADRQEGGDRLARHIADALAQLVEVPAGDGDQIGDGRLELRCHFAREHPLAVDAMRVEQINWIGEDQTDVGVKVRSLAPPVPANIDGDWIRFASAEYGVAPGQAAVFYDGSRLLGGGWIAETASAAQSAMNAAAA